MIHNPQNPTVTPIQGQQWTRPWASPQEIADERLAVHLYRHARTRQLAEASGLVCKVWRGDDPDWSGESRADDWPGVKDGRRIDRWSASRHRLPAA